MEARGSWRNEETGKKKGKSWQVVGSGEDAWKELELKPVKDGYIMKKKKEKTYGRDDKDDKRYKNIKLMMKIEIFHGQM